jgi:hypothetical protein
MSNSQLHRLRSAALLASAIAAYVLIMAILLAAAVHAEVPNAPSGKALCINSSAGVAVQALVYLFQYAS